MGDFTVKAVTDTQAVTVPDPIVLDAILAHRTKSAPLRAGIAAPANIEIFKTPVSTGANIAPYK
jgi:aromatic amino acid aminotransferase I